MIKDLAYYMSLNYPVELRRLTADEGGGYMATIPQLGSYAFVGDGETPTDALAHLEVVKQDWFEELLSKDIAIAEPVIEEEETYSGKFIVRLPKSLHRSLAKGAEREGVSLNSWVNTLLTSSAAVNGFEAATNDCVHHLHAVVNDISTIRYKFAGDPIVSQGLEKMALKRYGVDQVDSEKKFLKWSVISKQSEHPLDAKTDKYADAGVS